MLDPSASPYLSTSFLIWRSPSASWKCSSDIVGLSAMWNRRLDLRLLIWNRRVLRGCRLLHYAKISLSKSISLVIVRIYNNNKDTEIFTRIKKPQSFFFFFLFRKILNTHHITNEFIIKKKKEKKKRGKDQWKEKFIFTHKANFTNMFVIWPFYFFWLKGFDLN